MKHALIYFLLICGSNFAQAEETVSISSLKELRNAGSFEKLEGNVLVYFWASWCPDCREKLAGALGQLQAEFPKAKIVTVNSDRDEAKGIAFIEAEKISLPVYRDSDKTLSKALKLFAVPSWAVLKQEKKGLWKVLMSATGSDLQAIKQQLAR